VQAADNDGHAAGYDVARASDNVCGDPAAHRRPRHVHGLARQVADQGDLRRLGALIGSDECEVVAALDSGTYSEALLSDWIAKVPRQLLANNLGLPEEVFASLTERRSAIVAAA
jgi:hypothetical protein